MTGANNADNLIITGKKFTNVYVDCNAGTITITNCSNMTVNVTDCKNVSVNLTDVKDCTVTESDCDGIFKPSAKVAGR